MAKQRKANFELLRILLMALILYWHFVAHGIFHVLDHPDFSVTQPSIWHILVMPIRCYAVNCFILLSGYFGIKLTKQRFFSFSMQLLFYSILTFGLVLLLPEGQQYLEQLSPASIKRLFPASDTGWWFVSSYIFVMLLSPFLNAGVEAISQKKFFLILLVTLGVFLSGYHYYTNNIPNMNIVFVFIYLLGRYLRKYPIAFVDKYCTIIWLCSVACLVGHVAYLYYNRTLTEQLLLREGNITNPFNIIAAVSFFCMFKKLDIGSSNIINLMASGVFAAYVMTDGYLRIFWNQTIVDIFGTNIIVLFFVAIFSVLLFSCFEILRKKVQTPFDNLVWNCCARIWNKVSNKK